MITYEGPAYLEALNTYADLCATEADKAREAQDHHNAELWSMRMAGAEVVLAEVAELARAADALSARLVGSHDSWTELHACRTALVPFNLES